ncbi:MAG: energy-coupled thiamine transporter ThiT [Coriobacteriales bacterium]|jgi:thiamine transporter|nr:energy-coupled thiamine transporter ThiT [Coriobacteriales bacterium]
MQNKRTIVLVEVALCVALAAVLNFAAIRLPVNIAGGSVSLTMLPIAIVALRRGWTAGLVAGTVFGLLDLLMEPTILFPAQVLMDYPIPYLLFGGAIGAFSSLYNKFATATNSNESKLHLGKSLAIVICAFVVGGLLRYASHVASGVLFFAEYAGDQNAVLYSLIYNISYLAPSLIASAACALILMPILTKAFPPLTSKPSSESFSQISE